MAGEIQLNSTTMATESSGSITAQLDKIRPNTTNGSLVLQGDSSDSGVTGLTIDSSGNATFAGTAKSDTIKPKTTDASLTLQGDSSGSGVTGITIDSSGVVNTTTAKVTNIQATSGQSLTIKNEDGNAAITIGTDSTADSYLSLNFGSYSGGSSTSVSGSTLSDYEHGTFTAALNDGTTDVITSTGYYTKIGDFVYLKVQFGGGTATGGSGIVKMALPFAISNMGGGNVVHYSVANGGVVYAQHLGGADSLSFTKVAGSVASANQMIGSDYTSSSRIYFSYQYSTG